jgi:acyl carrier protein
MRIAVSPHPTNPERSLMSTVVTEGQIEKIVVESLESFGADPEQITPDATFEALDIDSLDLAELSQIVQERFDVELKGADVAEIRTVEDAIKLIAGRV